MWVGHMTKISNGRLLKEQRRQEIIKQKNMIARYASQYFVADGQIIILEAGTTAMAMVKYLQQQQRPQRAGNSG